MDDLELIYSILSDIDIVVLKRLEPGKYALIGQVPRFYRELYPDDENGLCSSPWQHSDMMAFFLEDAELFFSKGTEGKYSSGIWQEEGVDADKALFAEALMTPKGEVIILRRFHAEYIERAKILQKARENLLERGELKRNLELYKKISRYDGLTSLHNQAAFLEILQAEAQNAKSIGACLSLLIMDIDDFKLVNDTHGHLAGDAVLASFGKILQSNLRGGDIAARYGGEEFVILATNTSQDQALRMAENLRKRIENFQFPTVKHITVSIGCSTYLPSEDIKELIQRADFALYDAKRSGKNRVKIR